MRKKAVDLKIREENIKQSQLSAFEESLRKREAELKIREEKVRTFFYEVKKREESLKVYAQHLFKVANHYKKTREPYSSTTTSATTTATNFSTTTTCSTTTMTISTSTTSTTTTMTSTTIGPLKSTTIVQNRLSYYRKREFSEDDDDGNSLVSPLPLSSLTVLQTPPSLSPRISDELDENVAELANFFDSESEDNDTDNSKTPRSKNFLTEPVQRIKRKSVSSSSPGSVSIQSNPQSRATNRRSTTGIPRAPKLCLNDNDEYNDNSTDNEITSLRRNKQSHLSDSVTGTKSSPDFQKSTYTSVKTSSGPSSTTNPSLASHSNSPMVVRSPRGSTRDPRRLDALLAGQIQLMQQQQQQISQSLPTSTTSTPLSTPTPNSNSPTSSPSSSPRVNSHIIIQSHGQKSRTHSLSGNNPFTNSTSAHIHTSSSPIRPSDHLSSSSPNFNNL